MNVCAIDPETIEVALPLSALTLRFELRQFSTPFVRQIGQLGAHALEDFLKGIS